MAYTTINKSSEHFNTKLYTGNGSTQSITGVGFQPDFLWIKERSSISSHTAHDAVRGATKYLTPNTADVEGTGFVTSFNSDGFTLPVSNLSNQNNETYASWNWKAGSSNTSVSASGSGNGAYNSCTHRANTTAGFSIVQFTGRNGDIGNGNETRVTHGLGVKPDFVIIKRTDTSETWVVRGGGSPLQDDYHVQLNTTDARSGSYYIGQAQNDNATYFVVGNSGRVNQQGGTYIAYVFASKTGYSKFGSYTGNGNADGTFVYTGFKPAFVMTKEWEGTSDWYMNDTTRDPFNGTYGNDASLLANTSGAEFTSASLNVDMLSNGFKLRSANASTNEVAGYIYMAFAENPLVANSGTDGVPATAR